MSSSTIRTNQVNAGVQVDDGAAPHTQAEWLTVQLQLAGDSNLLQFRGQTIRNNEPDLCARR